MTLAETLEGARGVETPRPERCHYCPSYWRTRWLMRSPDGTTTWWLCNGCRYQPPPSQADKFSDWTELSRGEAFVP